MALTVNARRKYQTLAVTLNATVSPGKAGFLVQLFWFDSAHDAWVPISFRTTDAAGKVKWLPGFSNYPITLRVHLAAGQVIDGVEYGEYTSEQVTLMNGQEADLYLYPEAADSVVGDVTINASPSEAMLGDVITFTGRVLLDGVPPAGLTVIIYLDAAPADPVHLIEGETDANGYYSIQWTSNYLGDLPIYALAAAYQGFKSPTIIVKITEETTEPYTIIEDFVVPDSLQEGSDVNVRILLRNAGALGRLDWYINGNPNDPDRYIGVEAGTTPTAVSPGASVWVDVLIRYFPMPAWDYTLIAANDDGTSYISKTISLAVGEAKGSIVSYNAPSSAIPGDTVTVTAEAKNTGASTGTFRLRLVDRDSNVEVDASSWFTLASGYAAVKSLSGIMPDKDWNLRLDLERETLTGAIITDDQKTFTAINIVNRWDSIRAWWNSLTGWQKGIILTTSVGGVIIGGASTLKKS